MNSETINVLIVSLQSKCGPYTTTSIGIGQIRREVRRSGRYAEPVLGKKELKEKG
jgi:hypothetical protein